MFLDALALVLIALLAAAVAIRWDHSNRGRYFWQPAPAVAAVPAAPAAPAAAVPAEPKK